MNPLLFANLSTQRRLIRSASAYELPRMVVNVVFVATTVLGIVSIFALFMAVALPPLPNMDAILVYRIALFVMVLLDVVGNYVAWATTQAFFDIADSCLANGAREVNREEAEGVRERS